MRLYIFITSRISNVGGAENYIGSKKHVLESLGWNVFIFYYDLGNVVLPWFKTNCIHIDELRYPTYYYRKKGRMAVIEKMMTHFSDMSIEESVIESTIVDTSTWGELLAKRLGARHILYTLQEDNTITNESISKYLIFKYKRWELAGIVKSSIYKMMKSINYDISEEESPFLSAYQFDSVADYDSEFISKVQAIDKDYTICSIGRLNKPFVIPTIKSVVEYIRTDSSHKYLLLLIGGAPEGTDSQREIESICRDIPNLQLLITGYMFPIPSRLISLGDVFISSSGSARLSVREGIPTISIDADDCAPIGVLGETTNNGLFRTGEPILPLGKYLDDVLKNKLYCKKEASAHKKSPDYTSHFEFIDKCDTAKEYYDVSKLCWNPRQLTQRFIMPLIGPYSFHKLYKLLKK